MTEALREAYSSNARSTTDYGLKVIEISNAITAAAIDFFAHLLGQQVDDGRLQPVGRASAQSFRHRIRPEQGLVGTCPEACDTNKRADQEARCQGLSPRQLNNSKARIPGRLEQAPRRASYPKEPDARSNKGAMPPKYPHRQEA